ncbi:hypothetical protein [Candidatus Vampirococcus lugosii]|uniref:Uncharacterized protein n=1 Tax=Candidatus Vampirococcus lugosii TaxID=2789015 RepID=A0ABS5QMW4_9BACT|nr:hypothetical protein [Candidatus Vampirococcus lugosii]MBS8122560.1 hypothetical protein [Candidatus Vampirococcus lugosii]
MKIYQDRLNSILQINFRNKKVCNKKIINNNFDEFIVKNDFGDNKELNVFLLDENRFNYFSYLINENFTSRITIKHIKKILKSKINEIETDINIDKNGIFLFYHIYDIYINGEYSKYLIGNEGSISFKIILIYLNLESTNHFKFLCGNKILENKNIKIYPSSFCTINHMYKKLSKYNFSLLYIMENNFKILNITGGIISDISSISLGYDLLKNIFKDQGAINCYYSCFDKNIEQTFYSQKIIDYSLEFYVKTLIKRIKEQGCYNNSNIILSKLNQSQKFIDIFNDIYNKKIGGYILAYNYGDDLETFGYKFKYDEIDIVTYLNSI